MKQRPLPFLLCAALFYASPVTYAVEVEAGGCRIRLDQPPQDERFSWAGRCSEGFASGDGVLTRQPPGHSLLNSFGVMRDGRRTGTWTEQWAYKESEEFFIVTSKYNENGERQSTVLNSARNSSRELAQQLIDKDRPRGAPSVASAKTPTGPSAATPTTGGQQIQPKPAEVQQSNLTSPKRAFACVEQIRQFCRDWFPSGDVAKCVQDETITLSTVDSQTFDAWVKNDEERAINGGYQERSKRDMTACWTASIRMAGKTTFILAGWTGMNVAG